MGEKMTDRIADEIARNQQRAPYLSDWCHVASGDIFTVRMHVIIEATMEPAVVYYQKRAEPWETWLRPAAEFFDGRFERHTAPSES